MSDNNEGQTSVEDKQNLKADSNQTREPLKTPFMNEIGSPAFNIEYSSHKPQGLQSASDMWIDKGRLFEGLSRDKTDLEAIKKLSRQ